MSSSSSAVSPIVHGYDYTSILKQTTNGMICLPIDIDRFNIIRTKVLNDLGALSQGFELPPFFTDRPNSKAVGAHISVVNAKEANDRNVKLIHATPIRLNWGQVEIVNPVNWPGVKEIITLRVNSAEIEQLRENLGLGKPDYPFGMTIGVKYEKTAPVAFDRTGPIRTTNPPPLAYSRELSEIMQGDYSGTVQQQGKDGIIYVQIDGNRELYDKWKRIPETQKYCEPVFWDREVGIGLHSTIASRNEVSSRNITLPKYLKNKQIKFKVTGFHEAPTPTWGSVSQAISLTINCPEIAEIRHQLHLPRGIPPHVTIGVIFTQEIYNRTVRGFRPTECHA